MQSESVSELEGTIVEVMESWPLQLFVRVGTTTYSVGLTNDAVVTKRAKRVDPGALNSGMTVRIRGRVSPGAPSAMTGESLKILD